MAEFYFAFRDDFILSEKAVGGIRVDHFSQICAQFNIHGKDLLSVFLFRVIAMNAFNLRTTFVIRA
jgi:hypothetical protein